MKIFLQCNVVEVEFSNKRWTHIYSVSIFFYVGVFLQIYLFFATGSGMGEINDKEEL